MLNSERLGAAGHELDLHRPAMLTGVMPSQRLASAPAALPRSISGSCAPDSSALWGERIDAHAVDYHPPP